MKGNNSANSDVSLFVQQIRTASKFLYRDYLELENLQTSIKNVELFAEKSQDRLKENLQKSLGQYYNSIIFDSDYTSVSSGNGLDSNGSLVLVQTLDGANNFKRSIPFFAVIVAVAKYDANNKMIAEKVAINFPALGLIYYASKGKGAWLERHDANFAGSTYRLRSSSNNKPENLVVTCNYKDIHLANKISSNIRIFESDAYQVALVISGKSDCGLLPINFITMPGFELLIREAGGGSYIKGNLLIASNLGLQEKLKAVI